MYSDTQAEKTKKELTHVMSVLYVRIDYLRDKETIESSDAELWDTLSKQLSHAAYLAQIIRRNCLNLLP